MGRGVEGIYRLQSKGDKQVVFYYSVVDLNLSPIPIDWADQGGTISIDHTVFTESIWLDDSRSIFTEQLVKVKNCKYGCVNKDGIELYSINTLLKILREYKSTGEIPQSGSWAI